MLCTPDFAISRDSALAIGEFLEPPRDTKYCSARNKHLTSGGLGLVSVAHFTQQNGRPGFAKQQLIAQDGHRHTRHSTGQPPERPKCHKKSDLSSFRVQQCPTGDRSSSSEGTNHRNKTSQAQEGMSGLNSGCSFLTRWVEAVR